MLAGGGAGRRRATEEYEDTRGHRHEICPKNFIIVDPAYRSLSLSARGAVSKFVGDEHFREITGSAARGNNEPPSNTQAPPFNSIHPAAGRSAERRTAFRRNSRWQVASAIRDAEGRKCSPPSARASAVRPRYQRGGRRGEGGEELSVEQFRETCEASITHAR